MVNLSSMPSAPCARHGRDNTPNRVTVDEMRRKLPIGATGFKMFRTASGKPANAFCEYVRRDGARVAKYHDTEILALHPNGDVVAGFGGWHTLMTRERFNAAAEAFGLPLRCHAIGRRGTTGFRTIGGAQLGEILDDSAAGTVGLLYASLRIPAKLIRV